MNTWCSVERSAAIQGSAISKEDALRPAGVGIHDFTHLGHSNLGWVHTRVSQLRDKKTLLVWPTWEKTLMCIDRATVTAAGSG